MAPIVPIELLPPSPSDPMPSDPLPSVANPKMREPAHCGFTMVASPFVFEVIVTRPELLLILSLTLSVLLESV